MMHSYAEEARDKWPRADLRNSDNTCASVDIELCKTSILLVEMHFTLFRHHRTWYNRSHFWVQRARYDWPEETEYFFLTSNQRKKYNIHSLQQHTMQWRHLHITILVSSCKELQLTNLSSGDSIWACRMKPIEAEQDQVSLWSCS